MKIKQCSKCGGEGILKTTYDTEWVECKNCGIRTEKEVGDYYDEGFMDGSYAIPKWNKGIVI
ncbi:Lar family restriction alleviation protein [Clostridium rectalis]|uniref:Lar family restriction alleviation protein n=1 Tax=Clostridium rectalis TaxID=2040295 RepID=UPI000F632918|nr:Lar family restriction alleviation protein [Clostridium rectalis]